MYGLFLTFVFAMIILSITIQIFIYTMNYISDTLFGTKYNKISDYKLVKQVRPVRKVRFAKDQVKTYTLTNEERKMKKETYKRIRKASKHYMDMDDLCWLMEDLDLSN